MATTPPGKPRWIYRFDNFKRAFALLREAVEIMGVRPLTRLEQEGVVHRFEYIWELAWKVLNDFLQAQGVVPTTITPASVIRAGLSAKLLEGSDRWMRALDARNRMSHTYSLEAFERIVAEIRTDYLTLFEELYRMLLVQEDPGDRA